MKRIHIFRAGKHTATDGRTIEFTEAQLQASAAAYDPAVHAAPLVVGHPKMESPSYGEVESIAIANGDVDAVPRNVEPAFAELVAARRYGKVSASWYLPDSPSNPKPGVLYLRHVGFLGAMPPALKGLRPIEFGAAEEGVVEFADWGDMRIAGMLRGLRDWLIGKFGQDEADKALPPFDVTEAQIDAATSADPDDSLSQQFSEEESTAMRTAEEVRLAQEKLDADKAAFATQQAAFAEQQKQHGAKARRADAAAFVDGLVQAAKLPKERRDGLVEFMCALPGADVVEFGEGTAKVAQPPIEWFKDLLGGAKAAVSFGEVANSALAAVVDFAAPAGATVDSEKLELHRRVVGYQQDHPDTTYEKALAAVQPQR